MTEQASVDSRVVRAPTELSGWSKYSRFCKRGLDIRVTFGIVSGMYSCVPVFLGYVGTKFEFEGILLYDRCSNLNTLLLVSVGL